MEKLSYANKLICKVIKDDTEIMEIVRWDMVRLIGFTNFSRRNVCDLRLFIPEYGYFPVD
jgi:hypothetical protein